MKQKKRKEVKEMYNEYNKVILILERVGKRPVKFLYGLNPKLTGRIYGRVKRVVKREQCKVCSYGKPLEDDFCALCLAEDRKYFKLYRRREAGIDYIDTVMVDDSIDVYSIEHIDSRKTTEALVKEAAKHVSEEEWDDLYKTVEEYLRVVVDSA